MNRKPIVINVPGVGNRFACDRCYEENKTEEEHEKQSCRMTQQERETHKEAGKLRRMTDQQLIDCMNQLKERAEKAEAEAKKSKARVARAEAEAMSNAKNRNTGGKAAVERFLQALKEKAGTGNGIGNGTVFKLKRILDSMPDDFAEAEKEA